MAMGINFTKKTPYYVRLDSEKKLDIVKELNIQPIMEFTENYRYNWRAHFLRISSSRIAFKILRYSQRNKDLWEDTLNAGRKTLIGH
jgi:hypothetical protein